MSLLRVRACGGCGGHSSWGRLGESGLCMLLLARRALLTAGRKAVAGRCVTAAFYIVFFIYPSVSAKVFSTFNCEA